MLVNVKNRFACMGIKWIMKLWIIKTFWNIYLQDNYHFKDLNIWKKGLIFRIRIKNASKYNSRLKNTQKGIQIKPKFKLKLSTQESHSALLECQLAHEKYHWHRCVAWFEDSWMEINLTFFDFLEIRTRLNLYLIIQLIFRSIPTSINRGWLSKFSTLFNPLFLALLFWFFNSSYVKDVLEAFALGTSFL